MKKIWKKYRLIDFNGRRYDRHILYARMMGYNNEQIYDLSQRIISGDRNAGFALCSVGKMNDILMEEKGNEEDLEEV